MDVQIYVLGKSFRLARAGLESSGREVPWWEVERAFANPFEECMRMSVRRLLADVGHDSNRLDDIELCAAVARLLKSGLLCLEETDSARVRGGGHGPGGPVDPVEPGPPKPDKPAEQAQKYKLIEVAEVVDRGSRGTVGGATKDSTKLPKHVDRAEKKGACFKQFVNLGQDIDGRANRHPENGRCVVLWARIEWTSGDKSRSLAGKQVKWKLTHTKHSGGGRPATLTVAGEKFGLGAKDATLEKTSRTNSNGWATMVLHLSQFAGDEFKVSAALDTSDGEAIGGAPIETAAYIVWRKFWYQITKPDGRAVPGPTKPVTAYEKLGADMVAADSYDFKKTDTPAPPARTYYPLGMTKTGSADAAEIALIGGHNRTWFWGKFNPETNRPVKGHLIICDGQWDPKPASSAQTFAMPSRVKELTINIGGAWNSGILKPALSGTVLRASKWRMRAAMKAKYDAATAAGTTDPTLHPKPAAFEGTLSDADLSISLPRTALNKITITLPTACPDPTKYDIEVVLKATYGKFYGGESKNKNMLIVFRSGANKAYFQAVSHEFGHGFKQVPDKKNSASLSDHTKQYDTADGHGGSGSHCSTGVSTDAVSTAYPSGRHRNGTCIMFHQLSPTTCTQLFCSVCEPHLRLQDFKAF